MKKNYFKRSLLLAAMFTLFYSFSYSQAPYYSGTDITQTGEQLKDNLSVLIINTQTTNLTYTPGVWDALKQTDLDPTNPNNVLLIYGYDDNDGNSVTDRTRSKDVNGGTAGTDWNREHTYPRSLGNPNLGSTGPGSDAHHLRASDVTLNSNRSNFPYADANGNARVINGNSFYPGDEWKGDVARMMLYMYLRYDNQCLPTVVGIGNTTFTTEVPDIFLEWNAEDPVSQVEINRNVLLEGIQGNRNPFIDNPAFATSIWGGPQAEDRFTGGVVDNEAPSIPANLVAANTMQTETTLSWEASTDNIGVIAYQIFNGTTLVTSTSATTYTVTGLTANTSYTYTVKAIDAASNSSDDSNTVTVTTLEEVVTPPQTESALLITGVFDGPLSGGTPKAIELYAVNDIADLSVYGFGSANNGGGTDGEEFSLSGSATAGEYLYIATEETGFTTFFGFVPNFISGAAAINGDDAIELFLSGVVIDVFGDINVDGTSQPWEYLDGWASRKDATGADGTTFVLDNWTFSGANALDSETSNATATSPFPLGVYMPPVSTGDLKINGVFDGPLSGGTPKAIEFYVINDIADLSVYGFGSANNGGGTDGQEFTFSGSATAGDYLYIASEETGFIAFFGFAPDAISGAASINGDDAIELFKDGEVIDVFGDINVDGTGQPWEYLDGWASRKDNTGPDTDIFILDNWTFSGANALDGETSNATAATPFPIGGTVTPPVVTVDLKITGVVDGPLTGGTPKAIEFYVINDIADLSIYGFGSANNGEGTDGQEFTFTGSATAGDYIYVASEEVGFTTFFGFAPNATSSAAGINGDDAVELFKDGEVIDVFGDINVDGTGQPWDHLDGWASRKDATGPDGDVFILDNWTFSGINALDGATDNATAITPFPIGATVTPPVATVDLKITGLVDGPLTGGTPKAIEFYVINDIDDLSVYGFGSANNGGGTDGQEFTFSGSATAGDYIYVASEEVGFTTFFGFAPNATSGAAGINGDDAVELFKDGEVIDVFGDINVDGTGQPWDHVDGWASRKDATGPDGDVFILDNWTFSGTNALDGETDNATAAIAFPIGFTPPAPTALKITGVVDGPLSGGTPKVIELYAISDIADLSVYGFGSANNGGGSDGQEFALSGSAEAGDYLYIASEETGFTSFFGFAPNFTSGAAGINGDDAVELFKDGEVIDVFGDINVDGNGQPWEYLDGWASRKDDTGPDGSTFVLDNWTFSGANALDGALSNNTALTPFPIEGGGGPIIIPDPIAILEARNATVGELVTISGVLTVADQFSGSAYIQDATGAIAIFDAQVHGDGNFMIGDSITVTGTRNVFNDQVQISPVNQVENNGVPNQAIEPLTITLSELANHPAELVRIVDPNFPTPGDILFGNANYTLNDSSGSGEIRIDNDVEAIVGLGQPENCVEVIGVVGRFFETFQLLPRQKSDLSCADAYVPPTPPIAVSNDATLDVVTWNIEWFGDEANSPASGNPMSDSIQKDSVKSIITRLNADVYTVQEIADDALFAQLVSELPGYDYVLSPAVSRPDDLTGVKQKVGFIYNTATITNINTKVLLESIHPLYNDGDDSALVNYPSTTDRFYASGRLPFLMTADVVINGETESYNFVALHARANSSNGAQNRYDMRKYDVEVLKDSLDAQYPTQNLMILGDYNDDVDVTVADVTTTVSSYDDYVLDMTNYNIVSKALSEAGLRSFVSRENMIDHIAISNELNDNYIEQSVRVHYEYYDNDYTRTASDHFPVSARFQLKEFEVASTDFTNITCNGEEDGTATVIINGGIAPYSYEWSNGQTTATASELAAGSYSVVVMDALGNSFTEEFTIEEPTAITVTTTGNTSIYKGYENQSCTTLGVTEIVGGEAPYSYEWSTGETSETVEVCPEETTTYGVTIKDANGCAVSADIVVEVIDVTCGNNPYRPRVQICYNGRTRCVPKRTVKWYLKYGATLGSCDDTEQVFISKIRVYPNPFRKNVNIKLTTNSDTDAKIAIYSLYGHKVLEKQEQLSEGDTILNYNLGHLRHGVYYLKVFINGELKKVRVLIKK